MMPLEPRQVELQGVKLGRLPQGGLQVEGTQGPGERETVL